LKTNACLTPEDPETFNEFRKKIYAKLHEKTRETFYGCGHPIPSCLDEGRLTILDLGSGTGQDVFVCAGMAGPGATVIGVDMTDEQLDQANEMKAYHVKAFNLNEENIQFKKGVISDLKALNIADESVDIIISNCVVNLTEDKEAVFREVYRVLKPGGELYFGDIYSDRRIPLELQKDKVLWGE